MSKLREEMCSYMELKGYSPVTIQSYIGRVSLYAKYYKLSPAKLGVEKVREYLLYLHRVKKVSPTYVNSAFAALKILYTKVLVKKWDQKLPMMKRPKTLPKILSRKEVSKLLRVKMNLKHHAILALLYSTGIRLKELQNLKLKDIDSDQMAIRVNHGKGNKDRFTLLSKQMLKELREYYKEYKPKIWLFEGATGGQYSKRSIQHVVKKAKIKAKIEKDCSCHVLRHCFATHLLEQGIDIFEIKELLGHTTINTTMRYLHVNIKHMKKIKDPLVYVRQK